MSTVENIQIASKEIGRRKLRKDKENLTERKIS